MKTRLPFLLLALLLVALLAACGGGSNNNSVPADAIATVNGDPDHEGGLQFAADGRLRALQVSGPAVPEDRHSHLFVSPRLGRHVPRAAAGAAAGGRQARRLGDAAGHQQAGRADQEDVLPGQRAEVRRRAEEGRHHARPARAVRAAAEPARPGPSEQGDRERHRVRRRGAEVLHREQDIVHDAEDARGAPHPRHQQERLPTSSRRSSRTARASPLSPKQYSKDTGSAAQGGKLCVAHGGTSGACSQTVAPFDKAAFSLKTNEISQPVKSVYGWHVIQALGPVKAAHTQTFAAGQGSDPGESRLAAEADCLAGLAREDGEGLQGQGRVPGELPAGDDHDADDACADDHRLRCRPPKAGTHRRRRRLCRRRFQRKP